MTNRIFVMADGDNTRIISDWIEKVLEDTSHISMFKEIEVTIKAATDEENMFTFESEGE